MKAFRSAYQKLLELFFWPWLGFWMATKFTLGIDIGGPTESKESSRLIFFGALAFFTLVYLCYRIMGGQ